jgi:hypothetical protein
MPCGMCVTAIVRSHIESSDPAPSVAWVPGLLRVHRNDRDGSRVSSRRSNSLVSFGRVGHRDAIEEAWGRGAARRWIKRSPREHAFLNENQANDLLSQEGTTAPYFERKPDARQYAILGRGYHQT